MNSLHPDDPVYRQHQELVAEYRTADARGEELPPLSVLAYTPTSRDTLFTIAARLMVPYASIATLNRLPGPALPERPILVPTQPGLFVHAEVRTDLETALSARLRENSSGISLRLPAIGDERAGDIAGKTVSFYPGADFTPAERTLFLRVVFLDPLPLGVVSSRYGYRNHPMTGRRSFHRGLDLTAPFGTPVVAAASGVVVRIHRDPLLGLSIHVDHRNGYTTVYAHLQEAMVIVGEEITGGQRIGSVGSTGFSTGPHLHFEVLRDGSNRDPERYIR